MRLEIGQCAKLKSGEGPLLCVANDTTITGNSLEYVQCCYFNSFTEKFVWVQINANMLKVVDMPEIDDPPTVPPAE